MVSDRESGARTAAVPILAAVVGWLAIVSALVVNPVVLHWIFGDSSVSAKRTSAGYLLWALCLGALLVIASALVKRLSCRFQVTACQWLLLIMVVILILLLDRFLLVYIGRPMWVADRENHYRNRPYAERRWPSQNEWRPIRINRYGHHDDDFDLEKPVGEFRGLVLGDSIAMGHGVTKDEAFPNQLERLLAERTRAGEAVQIINTGVQGYSTFQMLNVLRRSLVFGPDVIFVGFYLNDVTEPFVVNRKFGGVGVDYHGVMQTKAWWLSWIANETGYGRFVQELKRPEKRRLLRAKWSKYAETVVAAAQRDDPRIAQGWDLVLRSLSSIYDIAQENEIPVVLLVFPDTCQLDAEMAKLPQAIVTEHAVKRNVPVIDFTSVFENLIFDPVTTEVLRNRGFSVAEIQDLHSRRTKEYFLDSDHYTPLGHRVVAEELLENVVGLFPERFNCTKRD